MNNWIKATELPSELPHTILTLMENGRMFAYNTSNNLKGLHEVIKHHPEILCLCVNLPSPDTPGEEGRAYLESQQLKIHARLLEQVKGLRSFFFKGSPLANMIDKIIEEHS